MALWQAYGQLAALREPAALNAILFFTDGQPTSVTQSYPIAANCLNRSNKVGVMAASIDTADVTRSRLSGIFRHDIGSTGDITYIATTTQYPNNSPSGCAFLTRSTSVTQDLANIPVTDIYGNSLTHSWTQDTSDDVTLTGGVIAAGNGSAAANFGTGIINAAASAAFRIRSGTVSPDGGTTPALPNVVIFGIGLAGQGAASDTFMEYVSNDPVNPTLFDSSKPAGKYILATDGTELNNAFIKVASEILRLSQ
jgi:hypothetical protein